MCVLWFISIEFVCPFVNLQLIYTLRVSELGEREREREIDRQTDKQTETHRERERERVNEREGYPIIIHVYGTEIYLTL